MTTKSQIIDAIILYPSMTAAQITAYLDANAGHVRKTIGRTGVHAAPKAVIPTDKPFRKVRYAGKP